MVVFIGIAVLVVLVYLPQWWVKRVFAAHQQDREDFPGTAGQLAEHVIETLQIRQASVQVSEQSNHFDPESKTVALIPIYHQGKSLTAITVAAHEIGHLLQLEEGNAWLNMRTLFVQWSKKMERFGLLALFLMPFAGLLTRSAPVMITLAILGFSGMLLNVVIHLLTLPMELDASFGKALPLLKSGGYISREDEPNVRQILWAAALTYLASALSSLLNLANWLRILRR